MLYISSRNKTDSFTAHRTLCDDNAPDGGQYLPYQLPQIDVQTLEKMSTQSFGENVAQILNLFFSAKLSAWDVECCIGRVPAKIKQMSYRIVVAECFRNPRNSYRYLVENLSRHLTQGKTAKPTVWMGIAIRISLLFAVYAFMPEDVRLSFDVALPTGDFSDPMAAWYARRMGLPIRKIICCCNDNGAAWDLLQRGEMNTNMPLVNTGVKELDHACPSQIERLIFHTLGLEQTLEYYAVCRQKGVFHVDEENFGQLSDGFAAAVVGLERIDSTIRSVYRSNQYVVSPLTAVVFGGLQDFRAKSGESQYTLILADDSPACHTDQVSTACGITATELNKALASVKE